MFTVIFGHNSYYGQYELRAQMTVFNDVREFSAILVIFSQQESSASAQHCAKRRQHIQVIACERFIPCIWPGFFSSFAKYCPIKV